MDASFIGEITHWHWLAFGIFLILLEIVLPGVIFLWLGVAGVATGLLLAALPGLGWELQLVAFALLSVLAIFFGRRLVASRQAPTDHPTLNRRGRTMVGVRCTLHEATLNGRGRARIGDTMWAVRVEPPDAELVAGAPVTVLDVDGVVLVVREADAGEDKPAATEDG